MSEKIKFDLVSPDNILLSSEVELVTIPGGEGDYGVMYGHQPMITTIRPGIIETEIEKGTISRFYVDGGFAEITNFDCSVLAEDAIAISDFKKVDIENRIKESEKKFDDLTNDLDISLNHIRLEVLRKILIEK
ncbi:MAG: ATP synthase epsilon chain [Alphaproteobacteria bacterium MarineAlpha2_Bin1]|nr:MAG: ATP synthase epsilon chain [Alphaproteobacteria bacterium MarineAlpha2_Bin1]|tara:strand:- start:5 stop:403 length:399 start_codon:yes stop_codon:yes gene_type:complete